MPAAAHAPRPIASDGAAVAGLASARPDRLPWWRGWLPLAVLPVLVVVATPAGWPRWAFMWTLAFAIYAGCKWLTWRRTPAPGAPWSRHLGYLLAWPGLDAAAFLRSQVADRPGVREWAFAAAKLALGVGLFFGLARALPADRPYLVGWVGMIGLVFALHFGVFHLLSCGWRAVGVDARPIMHWPIAATSAVEFWGRRWNTAFRDLTHRFLFRPLTARLGARGALAVGFVFSGLVHDVVVSLPAGGGYGGPTVFFLVQGAALFVERSAAGRRLGLGLGRGVRGWLFTVAVLVGPVWLLFHRPFVEGIIVPFMRDVGAI